MTFRRPYVAVLLGCLGCSAGHANTPPKSAGAGGGLASEGMRFFERYLELQASRDQALGDLFADDAVVTYRNDGRSPGKTVFLGKTIRSLMAAGSFPFRGAESHTDVETQVRGDDVVIKSRRYEEAKCYYDDGFQMELRREPSGKLLIAKLDRFAPLESQCPDAELGPLLEEAAAASRKDGLPRMIDDEARLDEYSAEGRALVYRYTLVRAEEEDFDLDAVSEEIYMRTYFRSCARVHRKVLKNGGTISHIYRAEDGSELLSYALDERGCGQGRRTTLAQVLKMLPGNVSVVPALPSPGASHNPTVAPKINIVETGIYTFSGTRVLVEDPKAPSGRAVRKSEGSWLLKTQTTTIPLVKGTAFGVTYEVEAPGAGLVRVTETKTPPRPLRDPDTGKETESTTQSFFARPGKPYRSIFIFDLEYEMVPGDWTIEIAVADAKERAVLHME